MSDDRSELAEDEIRKLIHQELISEDLSVRGQFLKLFEAELVDFVVDMAKAMRAWSRLHKSISEKNNWEEAEWIAALSHTAINLHIQSMKLLISGHVVASGNLFRQVIETISLTLLCSNKHTGVLSQFLDDKYSTHKAVHRAARDWKKLSLKQDAMNSLVEARRFYDLYSHPSKFTVATFMNFSEVVHYVGASFDEEKIQGYTTEFNHRRSLGAQFENFLQAVIQNVELD